MLIEIKDVPAFMNKAGVALNNFINHFEVRANALAKEIHSDLSKKKKFLFFKTHKNLPTPSFETLIDLYEIANKALPKEYITMREKGFKIFHAYRIIEKSVRIPKNKLFLFKTEIELIEEWAGK